MDWRPWPTGGGPLADDAERHPLRLVPARRVRRGKAPNCCAPLPALRGHAEVFLLGAGADGMDFSASAACVVLDYRRGLSCSPRFTRCRALLPAVAETFPLHAVRCEPGPAGDRHAWARPGRAHRRGARRFSSSRRTVRGRRDAGGAARRRPWRALQRVRANLRTHAPRTLHAMAVDYAGLLAPLLARRRRPQSLWPDPMPCAPPTWPSAPQGAAELLRQRRQLAEQQAELGRRADWALASTANCAAAPSHASTSCRWAGRIHAVGAGLDAEVRRLAPPGR